MLKVLEKPPFVRWKFVQRIIHRHRMNNTTGSNKYKTFNRDGTTSIDTQGILDDDILNESKQLAQTASSQSAKTPASSSRSKKAKSTTSQSKKIDTTTSQSKKSNPTNLPKTSKPSPFHAKKRLDKANESIIAQEVTEVEVEVSPKVSPNAIRRCRSDESLARILYDSGEEIDTTERRPSNAEEIEIIVAEDQDLEGHLTSNAPNSDKAEHNPLSFRRSSKLRSSLKEFKRRSRSKIDNARESMRRKVSAHKYDNLEPIISKDDMMVDYDRSPGIKRRQVIEI